MVLVCAPSDAQTLSAHLSAAGETVYTMGQVVARNDGAAVQVL
jgi:phosphoribosylaminoimidazole (AIR) synthetase